MFGFIKRAVSKAVDKKVDIIIREKVSKETSSYYNSISSRIDYMVKQDIRERAEMELEKQTASRDFYINIAERLNSMQLKSNDTK